MQKTLRRLFYHEAWGGIYVEAKSLATIKKWGWLEDVTDNAYHETEFKNFERAYNEKRYNTKYENTCRRG